MVGVFSWELNIPKLLFVEKVGGANFHGLIFIWVREDEIFVKIQIREPYRFVLARMNARI